MNFDIEQKSKELELIFDSLDTPLVLIDLDFNVDRINKPSIPFFNSNSFNNFLDLKCYSVLYNRSEICPYCPLKNLKKGNQSDLVEIFKEYKEIYRNIFIDKKNIILKFLPIYKNGEIVSFIEKVSNQEANIQKQEENLRLRNLASLGVMISGVAHELNNPLTGIGFTVQNLINNLEHYEKKSIQNRLDMVLKDLEKASSLVKDILNFSKPEKQKLILGNIYDVAIKAKETTVRLYPELIKNISWEIQTEQDFIFYFDSLKIERVFLNLYRNSIQAADYKKSLIRVDIKKKKHNISVSIEDNAGGISEDKIDKIFDPFVTSKKDSSGTGLGLTICHSIISEHGGKISVKSKEDRTKFQFSLPYQRKL